MNQTLLIIMDTFIGSILLVAFNYVPVGFAPCNGAHLSIAQNAALFSLLGTTYGGNGQTDFALPKIASPAKGLQYVIAIQGIFPSRE